MLPSPDLALVLKDALAPVFMFGVWIPHEGVNPEPEVSSLNA